MFNPLKLQGLLLFICEINSTILGQGYFYSLKLLALLLFICGIFGVILGQGKA